MQETISRIDSHVHFAWPVSYESLTSILNKTGADAVCLAALPGTSRLDPTPDLLCYKLLYPNTTFALGCLDVTVYEANPLQCGRRFVRRAKQLMRMGCDGIKLLEGKPTLRRRFPIPDFDSPAWEPFWARAEKKQIPLLWHVNDPEQFWNPDAVPAYAKNSGWGYGPEDVNNEAQYRQVWNVLLRHPRLNLTLPHFFFLSAQLPRMAEWIERFPRLRIDLTPGIELYENLSQTPAETRAFFLRFSDRIQYGTDIGGRAVLKETATELDEIESLRRVEILQHFLRGTGEREICADGHYLLGSAPFTLAGMGFDEELLKKIERENFLAFIGRRVPKKVCVSSLRRYLARLKCKLLAREKRAGIPADLRAVAFDLETLKQLHRLL
ncbi:MAG: amidohydrolase family protein [Christensenella sp.]|nr:amidohydrolase family protein [Christensenella sp.]